MTEKLESSSFFTRSSRLSFLRNLVEENSTGDFERTDLGRLFKTIDRYCAEHFPSEDRGGWFSPLILGGVPLNHTPPHILFATYAIYADLVRGTPAPVAFLAGPLNLHGATAVRLEPSDRFLLLDRDREPARMTDLLVLAPTKVPEEWARDYYGIPKLKDEIITVGWDAASDERPTAICGGLLFLHLESRRVLNPLATLSEDDEEVFLAERAEASQIARHHSRLVEFLGTPIEVLEHNHNTAKNAVEAYLMEFH